MLFFHCSSIMQTLFSFSSLSNFNVLTQILVGLRLISVCGPICHSEGLCCPEWYEVRRKSSNSCSSFSRCIVCGIPSIFSSCFSPFKICRCIAFILFLNNVSIERQLSLIGSLWGVTVLWYPTTCQNPPWEAFRSFEDQECSTLTIICFFTFLSWEHVSMLHRLNKYAMLESCSC